MKLTSLRRLGNRTGVLAVVLSTALILSGCGANNVKSTASEGGSRGGNLTIFTASNEMDFDPAKSQSLAITAEGLVVRRLTAWNVPRDGGDTTVVPDLATSTGEVSDGGKTWTFTLKDNLKYQDDTPITTADIKYGLERSFAPELSGGLGYHRSLLVGGADYKGPYDGQQLDSIQTPDAKTIIFHLVVPYGDFSWLASMPAFGPVPKRADADPQTYGQHPAASGPYQVQSYRRGVAVTLTRNPGWSQASDPVRTGGPDTVTFSLNQNATIAAQRLIADTGADQSAFGSNFVPPAQLAQIQGNPSAKARLVTSGSGALAFLAINTARPLLKDITLRRAIEYGVDKRSYRLASGGEIAGNYANTFITEGIAGRKEYNALGVGPEGDPDRARSLAQQAGYHGQPLRFVVENDQESVAHAESIQEGLKRAGINTTIVPLDESVWNDEVTGPKGNYDLTLRSWQPDFPSANANIQPLFDSHEIGNGGFNLSRLNSPEIDRQIVDAQQTVDPVQAERKWAALDRELADQAAMVPLIYTKNSFLIGSKIRDFYIGSFPAYPNYQAVTLAK